MILLGELRHSCLEWHQEAGGCKTFCLSSFLKVTCTSSAQSFGGPRAGETGGGPTIRRRRDRLHRRRLRGAAERRRRMAGDHLLRGDRAPPASRVVSRSGRHAVDGRRRAGGEHGAPVPGRRRPCSARRRRDELAEQGADLLACFAARARPTTVVVTADHGECLGEEGLYGHAFHHEKVMEVPLLIFRLNAGSDPAEPGAPRRVA